MKQQINDSKSVDTQIKKMLELDTHDSFVNNLLKSKKCSVFCKSIISTEKYLALHCTKTENHATLLGTGEFIGDIKSYCSSFINIAKYQSLDSWTRGYIFKRCIFDGTVLHTIKYTNIIKTNNLNNLYSYTNQMK